MRPHDEDLTPDEVAELGALLVAERPRPQEAFAAELDAKVAARFERERPSLLSRWAVPLRRPLLPAAAATLAIGLLAVVIALDTGGGTVTSLRDGGGAGAGTSAVGGSAAEPAPPVSKDADDTAADRATSESLSSGSSLRRDSGRALAPGAALQDTGGARKVERSASVELGAPENRVDDVAQGVLGVVARFDGIVDQSSVSSGPGGSGAQFALRFPAARLQPALAALSRLPDADVLARTDDVLDVNEAYVSIRRRLANARAERTGILNALEVATSQTEILELEGRLRWVERTIALTERAQRQLDRRVDYSRVAVTIGVDERSGDDDDGLTIGGAFDDAGRVLEVAAAVVVIAAAALVPFAVLLACAWPVARTLRRRRREQALDAAA